MSYTHRTILVVGLGLIGGSFAKAVKKLPGVERVLGFDLSREECELALALDVVDQIPDDLESAVRRSDLVMLAVPVKSIERVLAQIQPWLKPDTLITDVGSTKSNVVAAAKRIWSELPGGFVPGHPIAGAEKSGVSAADAELFHYRKVILTPLESSAADATLLLARLWQGIGAEVLQMDPVRHDEVLAATSHLPHLLAFSLVDTLAAEAESTDIFRYAAGGFRDFTRIAASDPTMWHDVCFANREQLLNQIDRFSEGVSRLRDAIDQGDGQALLGIFTRAKASREHFSRILERVGYAQSGVRLVDTVNVTPAKSLSGHLRLPGDRSISHRAIMIAALAEGTTDIDGFVESEDSLATIQVFRDLGVVIEGPHQGRVRVFGVGLNGLQKPGSALYFGNSITALKMLTGMLAAQPFDTELTGGDQLLEQDLSELLEPLRQMGAQIEDTDCKAPLSIRGGARFQNLSYAPQHSSAQIKAALIFAAISSGVTLDLYESNTTRDHTERLLTDFGAQIQRDGHQLHIPLQSAMKAHQLQIPADLSIATAFALAATLIPESAIAIEHTGVNPTRMQMIRLLKRMGARIEPRNQLDEGAEPTADLFVYSATLAGIDCTSTEIAGTGDDLPLLLVAMAFAEGDSQLYAVDRLPQNQKKLLELTLEQLQRQGVQVERAGDEILIRPGQVSNNNNLDAHQHPALAMACIIVGLMSQTAIKIAGCKALNRVFPEYEEQARRIGIRVLKES